MLKSAPRTDRRADETGAHRPDANTIPAAAADALPLASTSATTTQSVSRSSAVPERVESAEPAASASAPSIQAASTPSLPIAVGTRRVSSNAVERPAVASSVATPVLQRTAIHPTGSEIVWRRGGAPRTSGTNAGMSAAMTGLVSQPDGSRDGAFRSAPPGLISRQTATTPDTLASASSINTWAPAASGATERGPDSMQLLEQVTRRILRQIAIERERRGGGRWP